MTVSPEHLPSSSESAADALGDDDFRDFSTGSPDLSLSVPPHNPSERGMLSPGVLLAERYRLLRVLGRGATGIVYEAQDEGPLHRRVAIKILHPSSNSPASERESARLPSPSQRMESAQRRFLREIQVAGELQHPHIVTVYDAGLWQGQLYMVQALMSGRDLHHVLSAGLLPLERVLTLSEQLCSAVSAIHRLQIVHLDIKPGNILLDHADQLKLGDFDLARMMRRGQVFPDAPKVGTPGYMAPEQILGQPLDVRSDLFSLGCVLYLLLTGKPAFPGQSQEEIYALTLAGTPQPPSVWRPELPPALDRVLLRALASEPAQRYASASQLAQELLHYGLYSQLLSPAQALKLLAPLQASSAVTLMLGTALPCSPRDAEGVEALSQTHWLTHALRALTPELPPELETSPLVSDVTTVMRLLQQQSVTLGRAQVCAHLGGLLEQLEPEPWLRTVVQLRPRLILTTRQEDGLAQALTAAGVPVCRGFLGEPLPELEPGTVLIVHLLGNLTQPQSLLLEEDELWSQLRALETPGHPLAEEVRSRLASTILLYVGMDDAPMWMRRLADLLALGRMGNPPHGLLCQPHISLETLRWSTRRGLAALEHDPLSWLELVAQQVGRMAPLESSLPLPSRPYKRLDHFNPEDEPIFFGRERELQRLSSLILARPTSLMFGPSGSGKSSLIHAGLVPRLQRSGVDVLVMRPLAEPEEELRHLLLPYRESLDDDDPSSAERPSLPLWELLAEVARKTRLLVVVLDQAEELFVRHSLETRQHLAHVVSRALDASHGRLRWLWSLREDFLPRMAELQGLLPALFHNPFQLLPLTAEQARLAITQPAQKLGLEVEETLAHQLLMELCTERVEPPQLQLVCDSLYEALEGTGHRMTVYQLERLGGVVGILGGYLERMLQNLSVRERQDTKAVLLALVSPEGTRISARLEEIGLRTRIPPTRAQELLETLLQLRLLRLIPREEGDWFELTHEYLTREILAWQDDELRELRRLRVLLETGTRHHRLHGLLLPSEQLKLLVPAVERLNPSEEERALLQLSGRAHRRTQTQRLVGLMALLILLGALGLAGRYAMLSRAQFMRLESQTLAGVRWDEHETHTQHMLKLYQGSPRVSAVDELLGFPKFLESHNLPAEELSSQGQALLSEGIAFASLEEASSQLAKNRTSDIRVREHLLADRWTEAITETLNMLNSNRLTPEQSLRLLPLMAISGPPTRVLVEAALDHAERTELSRGLVAGTTTATRESLIEPYVLLLELSPRAWWQARLHAWVQRRETRILGLRMLGAVGDDRDAAVSVPWLNDHVFSSDVLTGLAQMNACSFMPTLLAFPIQLTCLEYPGMCLRLLSSCREAGTLPETLRFLNDLLQHPQSKLSTDHLPELFRALRVRGHPALGSVAQQWRAGKLQLKELSAGLGRIAAPTDASARAFQRQVLKSAEGNARFQAALRLARQGEPDVLPHLWDALPQHNDKSSFNALWAMGQFEGPALYQKLLTLAARTPDGQAYVHPLMKSPHARAGLLYALLPYDTPEVLRQLLWALADSDMAVASDAESCLVRFVERHDSGKAPVASSARVRVCAQLRALSESGSSLLRLRAFRVLQNLERRPNLSAFRTVLEQPLEALSPYFEALGGLREGLTLSSFAEVLEAMDSTQADIRRIAVVAAVTVPHKERLRGLSPQAPTWSVRQRRSLQQARWLETVLDRQRSLLPKLEAWLQADQLDLAKRWVEQQQLALGTWGRVMQQVLDLSLEEADFLSHWSRPVEAEFQLRRGELDWAVHRIYFSTADQPEAVRRQVMAARPLPELEQYLRYRQVMGLEPPKRIPPELSWDPL